MKSDKATQSEIHMCPHRRLPAREQQYVDDTWEGFSHCGQLLDKKMGN